MTLLLRDVLVCHMHKQNGGLSVCLRTGLGTRKHQLALSLSQNPRTLSPQRKAASVAQLVCAVYNLTFGRFPIASDFALITRETKVRWGSLGGR